MATQTPFKGADIAAAYKAIYGELPAGMMDRKGNYRGGDISSGAVLKTPTGENINASQLMYMAQKNAAPAGGGVTAATDAQIQAKYAQLGLKSPGSLLGASPEQVQGILSQLGAYEKAQRPQSTAAANQSGPQNAFGITSKDSGKGYTTLTTNKGQTINVDNAGNYFTTDSAGNNTPVSDVDAQKMGFQSANPETQALKQMGQVDPTSEALRTSVGKSYSDTLSQAQKPTAAQYQSYLDLFKQVDPEEYAQRKGLATSMDSYLAQAQAQNALGAKLDPSVVREIEQQTRAGQAARGNVYGTPQLTQEVMQRGAAGEARKQQRLQNLQGALGQQQGYLGAGLGLGDTAMNLYQQGLSNKQAATGAAMSYLGSGQTPYQAGASYLDRANAAAAGAAQGGPVYNPTALGQSYTGSAQQAPQYGLNIADQTQNWYNSLAAYGQGGRAPQKNKGAAAGAGALSGAASGALAGSAAGPYGTLIGAGVGAVAGGLGGYYS